MILLKKRGSKVAKHFALTFMDIGDEFQGAHLGMFDIARKVLNGIEPNTDVDMSCLYRNIMMPGVVCTSHCLDLAF